MPTPFVLQPGYSFSTELGKALGGGLGKGLEQGLSKGLSSFYEDKERIAKGLPQVAAQMRSAFKTFDPDGAFSPEQRRAAEEKAIEAFKTNRGIDPYSASQMAFTSLLEDQKNLSQKLANEQGAKKKTLGEKFKEGFSPSFGLKDVGKALNPVPGLQKELEAKKEANRKAPKNPLLEKKPIIEMTPQELGQISQERFANLTPQEFEQYNQKLEEAGQREATANWFKGLVPGYEGFEDAIKKKGLVGPDMGPQAGADLMKLVGGGQRLGAQIGALGAIPGGNIPQAAGAAALFGGSEAADQLANPNGPDMSAILREGAIGGFLGPAGRAFEKIAGFLKRVPTAAKAIAEGAKSAGVAEEKIIEEAVQNLEKRGITVDKLEADDPASLNELQKEAQKVSNLHKKSEKFNQKELEKIRTDVEKKLPESPLEEYYKPKEGPKTAEGQAAEEMRIAELEKVKKPLERRMQNLQYAVLSRESELAANRGKWAPEVIARQEAALQIDRMAHERALNDVRNIEFEIRNKKPRATDEQIEKQIAEQHAKLREHITNPTKEGLEKISKRIADDQKAIELAQRLAERGEIPGPKVMDEYIRIHKEYQKAYKTLQDDLKGFIREHKKDKEMLDQVNRAGEVLKVVERAQQINAAKINKQIDKRLVGHHLNKPSGAFYKQKLKDIRSDVDAFKKDFFQAQKAMGRDVEQTAQKTIKQAPKIAKETKAASELKGQKEASKATEEAVKNPSKENISKLAKEAGAEEDKTSEFVKGLHEDVAKLGKKVKTGAATDQDIIQYSGKIASKSNKLQTALKGVKRGVMIGIAQAIFEEITGEKIPQGYLIGAGFVLSGGKLGARTTGSFGTSTAVYKLITSAVEKYESEKLKSKRNDFSEFNKRAKELRNHYSKSKANRIIKKATQG